MRAACLILLSAAAFGSLAGRPHLFAANGELQLSVIDQATGAPIPVRMHLRSPRGRLPRVKGVPRLADQLTFDGNVVLKLAPGDYTYVLEHGPEYRRRTGGFTVRRDALDHHTLDLPRFADLAKEGWYSGDLFVQRPVSEVPLLMRAECLDFVQVITWDNRTGHWRSKEPPKEKSEKIDKDGRACFLGLLAGNDERGGGQLLVAGTTRPSLLAEASPEYPTAVDLFGEAHRQRGLQTVAGRASSWDLPVWLAHSLLDSIAVLDDQMRHDGDVDSAVPGRPRDTTRFPAPDGVGRWSQEIYYHLLNCGLRIPPSAASGSGASVNPPGYNRVYVFCGQDFTPDNWWANLRAGKVFVTNGPLLRPRVNGELPGHEFVAESGQEIELDIELSLSTREKVHYLEIVKNGRVTNQVRLDKWVSAGGELPLVRFDESGWMLVRAVTNHEKCYRYAASGPYYVKIGGEPRVSKRSAQFFLDWVDDRARQIQLTDKQRRDAVIGQHRIARDFWKSLVDSANAP